MQRVSTVVCVVFRVANKGSLSRIAAGSYLSFFIGMLSVAGISVSSTMLVWWWEALNLFTKLGRGAYVRSCRPDNTHGTGYSKKYRAKIFSLRDRERVQPRLTLAEGTKAKRNAPRTAAGTAAAHE